MLNPVVTLDARLSVAQAQAVLGRAPSAADVVVRDVSGAGDCWYAVWLTDLRRAIDRAAPDTSLGTALGLTERAASPTRQITDDDVRAERWDGIVLDGSRAVGIGVLRRGTTRGDIFAPDDQQQQQQQQEQQQQQQQGAANGERPYPGVAPTPAPGATNTGATNTGTTNVDAYARLEAPASVQPDQRFEVVIGLGTTAAAGAPPVPFGLQAGPGPTIELTVQVSADGFDTPGGIRRTLVVPKDNLSTASVSVALVAPPASATGVFWGVVEVQYSIAGVLVGKAWQGIAVAASPPAEPAQLGGTAVAVEAQVAADLTVTITEGNGPGRYVWVFTTPHDVPLPTGQVTTELGAGSARDFALEQVKNANAADGDRLALNQIKGIARTVAAAAPVEFWAVLTAVWSRAKAAGRTPSLLLVSDDPYIPWELASVEADYVVDRTLVDSTLAPVLGAHIRIGRWLPAGRRTPSGLSRPALPPTAAVDLTRMAVVVGDYRAETGIRPLPHAKEEGTALSDRYQAIWLGGTRDELGRVLSGQLTERGDPVAVQVLHLACHGEVDPQNPQYNGIVLSDSALRLDATLVRGGELGQAGAPLVFLNACQLASTTGELLGDYGGLAGAFLLEGCRGFIAPLWSVDDVLARDVALEFYRLTVEEDVTAGEAWRRIRGRFGADGDASQTTPLAYVYFGHPDLQITRTPARTR